MFSPGPNPIANPKGKRRICRNQIIQKAEILIITWSNGLQPGGTSKVID
jgi:hypothetical protein